MRAMATQRTGQGNPVLAHWRRAVRRYSSRLGGQFAAAITYFSMLSMIPILMVAFAAVGLTVSVLLPDLLDAIREAIADAVAADPALGSQLTAIVEQAFDSWQVVGLVGLLSALWSGNVWVNHLRLAIRAQFRSELDDISAEPNPVLAIAHNLATLFGLLMLLGVAGLMSAIATSARGLIRDLLQLPETSLTAWLLSLVPLAGNLTAGFVLSCFLFRVLPHGKLPTRLWLQASGLGALGMAALQFAAGGLLTVLGRNPASAAFGSAIVLMVFFNLFASMLVLIAAWAATATVPDLEPSIPVADAPASGPRDYESKLVAAGLRADEGHRVPLAVAERQAHEALRSGTAFGAVFAGAAAATLAALSARRAGRPPGRAGRSR